MTTSPDPSPRLSPADQGLMVVFALNQLWGLSPECLPDHPDYEGCCDTCCAPCDLLRRLETAGELDGIVQLAEPHHWQSSAWWDDITKSVRRDWLHASWGCQSNPPCDREDGTPLYGSQDKDA